MIIIENFSVNKLTISMLIVLIIVKGIQQNKNLIHDIAYTLRTNNNIVVKQQRVQDNSVFWEASSQKKLLVMRKKQSLENIYASTRLNRKKLINREYLLEEGKKLNKRLFQQKPMRKQIQMMQLMDIKPPF